MMKKKVLVLGSGGREHALVWAFGKDDNVSKVYCAPGNGGTGEIAENITVNLANLQEVLFLALMLTALNWKAANCLPGI